MAIRVCIDHQRFLVIDGVKACKIGVDSKTLVFHDPDRRRSSQRGTCQVEISLDQLAKLVNGGTNGNT